VAPLLIYFAAFMVVVSIIFSKYIPVNSYASKFEQRFEQLFENERD